MVYRTPLNAKAAAEIALVSITRLNNNNKCAGSVWDFDRGILPKFLEPAGRISQILKISWDFPGIPPLRFPHL